MTRKLTLILLVIVGAVIFWLPIKTPLNIYDEGIALVNGVRVLDGQVPFRDYWAIYPPGQSYALAAIFKLAGPTILAERVYDSLIRLACALIIFLVATRILRTWAWALVPYGMVLVLFAAATFYGYAIFPALLFAFLAILYFFDYLSTKRTWQLLAAGLAIGLTSLFRVDLAAYVGVALMAGLLVFTLYGIQVQEQPLRTRWNRFVRQGGSLSGGALLIFLTFYGYLAWVGNLGEMVNNLLIFPTTTFHAVRHLPYPPLQFTWARWNERGEWLAQMDWTLGEWLRFYLPLLIYSIVALIILFALLRAVVRRTPVATMDIQGIALLGVGLGLFVQAMSRYDAIHALPTSLPTILLIGWLWRRLVDLRGWRNSFAIVPGALTLVPLFVYGYLPLAQLTQQVEQFPPTACYSTLPRASCVPILDQQAAIIDRLDRLDPNHGALFIAAGAHDRIFINDVSLYFLAGRPIPTRYHELHPGVATTLPVQMEISQELTAQKVQWIIIADWGNPNEPNESAVSSGVTELDKTIRTNYTRVEQVGSYQLWQRK